MCFIFFTEYLANSSCTEQVFSYLEQAGYDDDKLLMYLRARKLRPEHAWQTVSFLFKKIIKRLINLIRSEIICFQLKRNAEVCLDMYPEIFTPKDAHFYENFQRMGLWGILKNVDGVGRPILCIHSRKYF